MKNRETFFQKGFPGGALPKTSKAISSWARYRRTAFRPHHLLPKCRPPITMGGFLMIRTTVPSAEAFTGSVGLLQPPGRDERPGMLRTAPRKIAFCERGSKGLASFLSHKKRRSPLAIAERSPENKKNAPDKARGNVIETSSPLPLPQWGRGNKRDRVSWVCGPEILPPYNPR